MKKMKLNVDELQIASFEMEEREGIVARALITSANNCTTRYPTIVGSCCTPLA
jgi:hypothetical protein